MVKGIFTQNRKKLTGILPFFLVVFLYPGVSRADDIRWNEVKTKHTIIRYQADKDLKDFDRKIDYSAVSSSPDLDLLISGPDNGDLKKKIINKVDAIYRRVQEILGMRKAMDRVKVNIYRDSADLKKAFYDIYKKEGKLRAWYIYEYNTIYINVKDLHEGMLAHEIAHSIIDHYLSVRPPSASAEILARYVDSHLMR